MPAPQTSCFRYEPTTQETYYVIAPAGALLKRLGQDQTLNPSIYRFLIENVAEGEVQSEALARWIIFTLAAHLDYLKGMNNPSVVANFLMIWLPIADRLVDSVVFSNWSEDTRHVQVFRTETKRLIREIETQTPVLR